MASYILLVGVALSGGVNLRPGDVLTDAADAATVAAINAKYGSGVALWPATDTYVAGAAAAVAELRKNHSDESLSAVLLAAVGKSNTTAAGSAAAAAASALAASGSAAAASASASAASGSAAAASASASAASGSAGAAAASEAAAAISAAAAAASVAAVPTEGTFTVDVADFAALGAGVKTHDYTVALPANARLLALPIAETFTGFDDPTHGTMGATIGTSAGGNQIGTSLDLAAGQTGFPKAWAAGASAIVGTNLGGSTLTLRFTSSVDLNTLTAGHVVGKVLYSVVP